MTLTTDELERSLRRLGDGPAPEPEVAFATALEDRLRNVAHLSGLEPSTPVRRPGRGGSARRRSPWLRPAMASGLAFAVLAAGFALARPGQDDSLRVAAASDSLVVLPDGTVGAATPGLLVPDGSTLQTGADGHLLAGGVELGPNNSVTVTGGAIQPASGGIPPTPKPTTPATRPVTGSTATTAPRPVGPEVPPATQPPVQQPPVVPTWPTTATTGRPGPPATTATTKPSMTTDTKPSTTPDTKGQYDPAVRPQPVPLKLEAVFAEGKVRLVWSPYDGADFDAYLVLRADSPAEPAYPVDEKTTVVARITTRSKTDSPCSTNSPCGAYWDSVKDPANAAYRIVALDNDRRVVAASPVVRTTPKPGPSTTTTTAPPKAGVSA